MNSNSTRATQLVCRTCLKVINQNELYINAESTTKYGTVIDMLETCVSEMNLDFSDTVVMCCNCTTMLRISYEFKLKCLHTEDKVFGYIKEYDLPIFSKINLSDVIANYKDSNVIDLCDEKKNVAIIDKDVARSLASSNYSLNMELMGDTDFLRKESSPHVDAANGRLYENATGLNKTGSNSRCDNNDGILTFDDLTNMALDDILRNNYRISPVEESNPYRNMDTFSHSTINEMCCDMNLEKCRSNLNNEEFCDDLFKIPSCGTPELNKKDNAIDQFVFRAPLIPKPKRK